MSAWAVAAVLLGTLIASLLTLVVMRRREGGWWADPGRAAGVLGAARGPFAVILAFVILVAFQGFNNGRSGADMEASATRTLFKTAGLFQGSTRDDLQANVLCYARAVINLDWPAMRSGTSSTRVDDVAASIEDDVRAIDIRDDIERAAATNLFTVANQRQQGRDTRLSEAGGRVPQPVWIVIVVGAVAVLAYVLLFADPRERFVSQAVMVGSVTLIVVGGLLLVWFLSHPFQDGPGSIRPTAMEHTLRDLQRDPSFAETGLPRLCDSAGRALPVIGG
jgi:hypothetical protein